MLETSAESLSSKIEAINAQLQEWLSSGKVIVDQSVGIDVSTSEGSIVLKTNSFAQSEQSGVGEGVSGACRIVNPSVAGELLKKGLVSDFEYYVLEQIWHPAFVATIEADEGKQRVLIDMGMRKPIPIAIPLNGEEVTTDFYENYAGKKRTYSCYEDDAGLHLKIKSGTKELPEMLFKKATPDDEIPIFTEGFREALKAALTRTTFDEGACNVANVGENLAHILKAMTDGVPKIRLIYGGKAIKHQP